MVSAVAVVGIFISNIPEGLSSATGMRHAGWSAMRVVGVWAAIALISGWPRCWATWSSAALPLSAVAAITGVAAGGVLAMLADTMIPEAFEIAHEFTGLITVAGFLVAFVLSKRAPSAACRRPTAGPLERPKGTSGP